MRRTTRGGSGPGHWYIVQDELLKLENRSVAVHELVKMEDTQIHSVSVQAVSS